MKKFSLFIVVLVMVILTYCKSPSVESSQLEKGKIELVSLDGNSIDLDEFKGKTVFLNFWATWCKPCIAEMPSIARAQKILKDSSVVFLLASNESKDKIERFKGSYDFDFNYIRLTSSFEELGIMALPTTYIIAPNGDVIYSEMGGREWDKSENIELIQTGL